jgi:hypothetical protein
VFLLKCTSYPDGGDIPLKYAHTSVKGGWNVSPCFTWEDPPIAAKSFALSIIDPHPVANNWVHWIVAEIPFRERSLPEGASRTRQMPPDAQELINSYNELGYGGPAPPKGSGVHPYVATIYALNVPNLRLDKSAPLSKFLRALEGKVIAEASMTGNYEQK